VARTWATAVDGGKARIILTALVTPSEVLDNQPMLDPRASVGTCTHDT
jgi:hypothetical protein